MPADPAAAKALFLEAIAIEDPNARGALISDRCAEDTDLFARVHALLAANERVLAHAGTATFDGAGGGGATADYPGHDEHAGGVIGGKYTLVEPIGEGGMGSVWRAKQTEPVKRFVAIKLIKAGMDSKQVLARFEAERQALALMDHPHIAKVLDGGVHDGRPFFVMELVKGVPITRYCDAHKFTPRQRLELFANVCQAIQHAHQKGIIHRDIKPRNVLVAMYDDRPVVKVIDFGVAKATGQALTERTIDTGFGGIVGTPEYMSPEQATFNNLDIDTRSDVYALGVLLYELLTGSPPFAKRDLEQKGLLEMLRVVREEEPPRPSTKLSTADALPTLSADRGTEPKKLTGLLRNELDWIVMKALEKDRTRRYETANSFAADVLRYLSGEAVQAHPPSTAYRLNKFVRRNRAAVIGIGAVAAALVVGVVGTTLGLIEAKRQEGVAKANEALAKENEEKAKAEAAAKEVALKTAENNLRAVKRSNEILGDVFAKLDPTANYETVADLRDALKKNVLDAATKKLEGSAIGDPLTVAEMQNKLGESLLGLGEPAPAVDLFKKSRATREHLLGPDHPDTLRSMHNLADGSYALGKYDLAVSLWEEALNRMKVNLGPDHSDTLETMRCLAGGYYTVGKLDLALPLAEETLKRREAADGRGHNDTLTAMHLLAICYRSAGKLDRALPLWEEVFRLRKAHLGPDHPHTLTGMSYLGLGYLFAGNYDRALPLLEEVLQLRKARLGLGHAATLMSMSNLALGYQDAGKPEKALPLLQESLKLLEVKQGPDHLDTLLTMDRLATCYQAVGEVDLALTLWEVALQRTRARHGSDRYAVPMMGKLALAYFAVNQSAKATPLAREYVAVQRTRTGNDRAAFAEILQAFSLDLLKANRFAEAVEYLRECLAIREKLQPDSWATFNTSSLLGGALLGQQRYAEAEPLLVKGYEGIKSSEKSIPKAEALDRLIDLCVATNKTDEAKKWRAERARYPEVAPPPREKK
jgi:serine/threonine protein kinase/TolA-binding protein